jgi:large subunit ribosomal protein L10
VKKGEEISQRLAAILSKLGIKPVEAGLVLNAVYDDGAVITEEQLHLDLNKTRADMEVAHRSALHLSVNSVYFARESIELLLRKARDDAFRLSVNENIPTKNTVSAILRKAHTDSLKLKTQLDTTQKG